MKFGKNALQQQNNVPALVRKKHGRKKSRDTDYRRLRREQRLLREVIAFDANLQSNNDANEAASSSHKSGASFNNKKQETFYSRNSSAIYQRHQPNTNRHRFYTVSLALPSSILDGLPSLELKTLLASRIARALAVHCVDEVVVFDEEARLPTTTSSTEVGDHQERIDSNACMRELYDAYTSTSTAPSASSYNASSSDWLNAALLALLLKHAECPQYLRQRVFPAHPCLAKCGLMAPLSIPSHQLQRDVFGAFEFREGCVLPSECDDAEDTHNNLVDIGLEEPIKLSGGVIAPINSRVTVHQIVKTRESLHKHNQDSAAAPPNKKRKKRNKTQNEGDDDAEVEEELREEEVSSSSAKANTTTKTKYELVSRDAPRYSHGVYWGYRVRLANGLTGALRNRAQFDCDWPELPNSYKHEHKQTTEQQNVNQLEEESKQEEDKEEKKKQEKSKKKKKQKQTTETEMEEEVEELQNNEQQQEKENLQQQHTDTERGYDLVLGTSDRGMSVKKYRMGKFRHLLVLFGGVAGLEQALLNDPSEEKPSLLTQICHAYLNACPTQGSRTIRTEEAIPIALTALQSKIALGGVNE